MFGTNNNSNNQPNPFVSNNQFQQIRNNPVNLNKDEFKLNSLMSSSLEDLINKWKIDLDSQVSNFEKSVDSLKEFEINFQKDYNKVY
jgi:hypothetical protein